MVISTVCLAVALFAGAPKAPADKPRLVVLNPRAEEGVSPGVVRLLTDLALTKFQETGVYTVVGESDVGELMQLEAKKDLLRCNDDACLTELAGALGADFVVASSVGRVGKLVLLNMKLLDGHTAEVHQRWSKKLKGDEEQLIEAMEAAVEALTRATPAETAGAIAANGAEAETRAADAASEADRGLPPGSGAALDEGSSPETAAIATAPPTASLPALEAAPPPAAEGLSWPWFVGGGAAVAGAGLAVDLFSPQTRNADLDALDFVPLGLYLAGAGIAALPLFLDDGESP